MEWQDWQTELLTLLGNAGVSKEDIFSVMLVLTNEDKGKKMIACLREHPAWTADDICRTAGEIAFSDKEA